MSRRAITASPRFNFSVPETVYDDLLQCYAQAVLQSDAKMRLTADTERILRMTAKWMQTGKRGLLLIGDCGTGKTKLLQAMSLLFCFYENDRNWLRVYSASDTVKLSLSKDEKDINTLSFMKTANYVGIDDVGTESANVKNYGTDLNPIADILFHRYNAMKVTVLSSNLNMEEIRIRYEERIHDRLCEMCDRIIFKFQSFRQIR